MDNKHRPFIIKKHDTLPSLTIKIKARDCINAEVSFNLSAVTACTFSMVDEGGGLKISSSQAQITSASAGTVQYYWTTDDTDTVGQYKGEFELYLMTEINFQFLHLAI